MEYFEKEYIKLIGRLKDIAKKEGIAKEGEEDDFEAGISYGREGLAKELIIQMQSIVIETNYGEM